MTTQNARVFKSAVSVTLVVLISLSMVPTAVLTLVKGEPAVAAMLAAAWAFVLHVLFGTRYTIVEDRLRVRSGIIYNRSFAIADIKSIKPTNSILSAPAAAIKGRLEIAFNKGFPLVVSPKQAQAFIDELTARNPNIAVKPLPAAKSAA